MNSFFATNNKQTVFNMPLMNENKQMGKYPTTSMSLFRKAVLGTSLLSLTLADMSPDNKKTVTVTKTITSVPSFPFVDHIHESTFSIDSHTKETKTTEPLFTETKRIEKEKTHTQIMAPTASLVKAEPAKTESSLSSSETTITSFTTVLETLVTGTTLSTSESQIQTSPQTKNATSTRMTTKPFTLQVESTTLRSTTANNTITAATLSEGGALPQWDNYHGLVACGIGLALGLLI